MAHVGSNHDLLGKISHGGPGDLTFVRDGAAWAKQGWSDAADYDLVAVVAMADRPLLGIVGEDMWQADDQALAAKGRNGLMGNIANYLGAECELLGDYACQVEAYKVDVSELYSLVRATAAARRPGLRPGLAADLSTGCDLSDPAAQRAVWKHLEVEGPEIAILSPGCRRWGRSQSLNDSKRSPEDIVEGCERARGHWRFCRDACLHQWRRGRGFLFEQKWSAKSWGEGPIQAAGGLGGVEFARAVMCARGTSVTGDGMLNLKPAGLLADVPEVARAMGKARCNGERKHGELIGWKAKRAQKYLVKFCWAIVAGLKRHIKIGGAISRPEAGFAAEAGPGGAP